MSQTLRFGRSLGIALLLTSSSCMAVDAELPHCSPLFRPRLLLDKEGPIESIAFDHHGRLLYTDVFRGSLKRLDQPESKPISIASGISRPGGIVVVGAKEAFVGTGNTLNGFFPSLGGGGIARVDLERGNVTPAVSGLSMANGLVRAKDGTFYASDDFAPSLDRVLPNGTVQRGWLEIVSNGLVLSADEKTLYVNQAIPAKILAVNLGTGEISAAAKVPASRKWSFLDGLDRDGAGRMYVAAYLAGEVWRVGLDGKFCLLADALRFPAAVAAGRDGSGFKSTSVYVATHSGQLYEIPEAVSSVTVRIPLGDSDL